jgi:L-alanine-DL-glutamate epimerase-like enolase superfamily enzyme
MMEARSVDIVMIDLMRAGGVPAAQDRRHGGSHNLPVVSHLVPSCTSISSPPNGLTVEYHHGRSCCYAAAGEGELIVPKKPGHGLFDEKHQTRRLMARRPISK